MAAKSSDLAEETSGASLQVDGHMEEPTQGAKNLWELEEDDSSPFPLAIVVPSPGRRIGGHTPTFSLLDGPTSGRYVARSQN